LLYQSPARRVGAYRASAVMNRSVRPVISRLRIRPSRSRSPTATTSNCFCLPYRDDCCRKTCSTARSSTYPLTASRPCSFQNPRRLCRTLPERLPTAKHLGPDRRACGDLISHAREETLTDISVERVHVPCLLSMMLDHIDRHSGNPELGAATLAVPIPLLRALCAPPVYDDRSLGRRTPSTRSGLLRARASFLITIPLTRPLPEIARLRQASATSRISIALFKRCNGFGPRGSFAA